MRCRKWVDGCVCGSFVFLSRVLCVLSSSTIIPQNIERKVVIIFNICYGCSQHMSWFKKYSKTCVNVMATLKKTNICFQTNYCLMQIKSIAECHREHSAIRSTFIKLPCVFKIFVLSIFEWPFYTGFTVEK